MRFLNGGWELIDELENAPRGKCTNVTESF